MISQKVLEKYWGYQKFRPLQEEIVQSILDGKDKSHSIKDTIK
jgi:ATP-dependent DNA helicase RecQ